ncbi:ankyrin repeat domain-containing protein [Listeria booriae]|nr:ankyrin repeat domain-containing protein [Listeria booriae]
MWSLFSCAIICMKGGIRMRKWLLSTLTLLILTLTACTSSANTPPPKEDAKKQEVEEKPMTNNNELNQDLLQAIATQNIPEIKTLLEQGAKVDVVNNKGESGLLVATHHNNIEMAQLFLDHGANVNLQDHIQDSPFLYAGAEGRTEILKRMLSHNPDYTLTNRYGGTALIPAAEKGHLANVELLLKETTIDVNHINKPGWTALLEAIVLSNGGKTQQQIVQALLEDGADPNIADANGGTPLAHAKQHGYKTIADLLISHGAK